MQNGWIKLHRKVLSNDIFRFDRTAWHVFEMLLLVADKDTGCWKGGLFQLSAITNINKDTLYKSLKRLEESKMITRSVNTKYTAYCICKWKDYQSGSETLGILKVKPNETQSKTLTRIENRELRSNTKVLQTSSFGDKDINEIVEYFKTKMELPKLDGTIKGNRYAAKRILVAAGDNIQAVKQLIDCLVLDNFHAENASSIVYLDKHKVAIMQRARKNKSIGVVI